MSLVLLEKREEEIGELRYLEEFGTAPGKEESPGNGIWAGGTIINLFIGR